MADLEITYNGSKIVELSESGNKTLKTSGKYCEGDISVAYTKASGGGAFIVVTSTAGALLTCGSQTYQLGNDETQHQFAISVLGTYTVTASKDSKTKSATVIVSDYAVYFADATITNIPTEYQEVEYLQSTGTQYIDTGIYANQNTSIDITFQSNSDVGSGVIFCGEQSYDVAAFHLYRNNHFDVGFGNVHLSNTGTYNIGVNYRCTLNSSAVTIYNQNGTVNTNETISSNDFVSPNSCFLYAINRGSTPQYISASIIYDCKMYNSGILTRDFVPCYRKSDSVAGMYDKVTNTFFTNLGTGSFIVGGDVQ